jgi:hypothetical protein
MTGLLIIGLTIVCQLTAIIGLLATIVVRRSR